MQTKVNGQTFAGTGFMLDGTDNRDPILGIIVINPTLESVTEAKMTSQNYDAEFGQAIAGVVASQTKSGTNSLHGSAFGFRRSDATQARDPFSQSPSKANPVTGRTIPPTLYGQYGAQSAVRSLKTSCSSLATIRLRGRKLVPRSCSRFRQLSFALHAVTRQPRFAISVSTRIKYTIPPPAYRIQRRRSTLLGVRHSRAI